MKLQPVRGTQDYPPEVCQSFRWIDQTALHLAERYGFEEFDTPIFEFSEVFHRTLGETSDMVSKETYNFKDRGDEALTLRPEGTAGIARAFITGGMAQNLPLKFYYSGPMFRYERPQKGRYRQFHQLGVEYLGSESPFADVECISLAWELIKSLQLTDKSVIEINSLGDKESREKHKALFVEYLQKFKNDLSDESKIRLEKNPLRILDSKSEGDQKIVQDSPSLQNCLNDHSKNFYDTILTSLEKLNIPFKENARLVRGIDYYCHTVFEVLTTHLGAQGALVAGGRYDGLIELMGGPKTPGVGWASGMERLSLLVNPELVQQKNQWNAVVAADESAAMECLALAQKLRQKNRFVEYLYSGNMGKKMKKADKLGCEFVYIIGENELKNNQVTVKNLKDGTQRLISLSEI